jgi:hypothetical protein
MQNKQDKTVSRPDSVSDLSASNRTPCIPQDFRFPLLPKSSLSSPGHLLLLLPYFILIQSKIREKEKGIVRLLLRAPEKNKGQQMTSDHRSRPVWDGILVETVRLTPCTRPAGTTSCITADGVQRNPWNSAAFSSPKFRGDAASHVSMGGLKARRSLAQGNALWYGRRLSTPEAPTGRNPFARMAPFQGLAFAGHSFRRALPYAVDDLAFSPALHIMSPLTGNFTVRSRRFTLATSWFNFPQPILSSLLILN